MGNIRLRSVLVVAHVATHACFTGVLFAADEMPQYLTVEPALVSKPEDVDLIELRRRIKQREMLLLYNRRFYTDQKIGNYIVLQSATRENFFPNIHFHISTENALSPILRDPNF